MKIKLFFICLFIFIKFTAWSYQIHTYELELINIVKIGNKESELGLHYFAGGPTAFCIDHNNYVYIVDSYYNTYDGDREDPGAGQYNNPRIVIFDINFNYLREFVNRKTLLGDKKDLSRDERLVLVYPRCIKIDEKNNVYLAGDHGLVKIDKNGKLVYHYTELPKIVKDTCDFHIYNEILFYYTEYTDKRKINSIDKDEIKLDASETKKILDTMIAKSTISFSDNKAENARVRNYMEEKKILFLDNKLLTANNHLFYQFIDFLQENKIVDNGLTLENFLNCDLIGYDKDNNIYWRLSNTIMVFSNKGKLLDCFENKVSARVAVSYDGDIYIMQDYHKDGIAFYKITRRW
jgi:hypothetical protein